MLSDPVAVGATTPTQNDQGWETWTKAGLQQGKEVYMDRCQTCHGCAGNGLGTYGGTLIVTPANFKQYPFRDMPEEEWFWHVSEGIPGSVMPPWKESLNEEDRWLAIRYVRQIFSIPVMRDPAEGDPSGEYANLTNPVPLTVEALEQGKDIFTRECMICHGAAGRGDGPYAQGLQPSPPDFGDGSYGTPDKPNYTDSDYFWRISEGLPWSAMPPWKLRYSKEDRWKLAHYVSVTFTQTVKRPKAVGDQVFPEITLAQTMPQSLGEKDIIEGDLPRILPITPSYERGKLNFMRNCAQCHGLDGRGTGWHADALDVPPVDLRSPEVEKLTDGELYARVSFGTWDSSMPAWGEWMPENQRWDAILFIRQGFQDPKADMTSRFTGEVSNNMLTLSSDNWTGEGHVISPGNGKDTYATYCQPCHGHVDGPPLVGGPAAYPAKMPEAYVFWRVNEGIPGTAMPPLGRLLPESDIWNVTAYLMDPKAAAQGGK